MGFGGFLIIESVLGLYAPYFAAALSLLVVIFKWSFVDMISRRLTNLISIHKILDGGQAFKTMLCISYSWFTWERFKNLHFV